MSPSIMITEPINIDMNIEMNVKKETENHEIVLEFSELALQTLDDILMSTLSTDVLRIMVTGKGCDGFTYQFGLTEERPDDVIIAIPLPEVFVHMDPFTAFYGKNLELDFVTDAETKEQGFLITDRNGETYKGKFWKEKKDLIPSIKTAETKQDSSP
jgi:iron-sulfur cluster insertion protein